MGTALESLPSFQKAQNSICNARRDLEGMGAQQHSTQKREAERKREKMHAKHFDSDLVGRSMS